jgi:hypothetical protein
VKRKYLGALGPAVLLAVALAGTPAMASGTRSPLLTVRWQHGPSSTFAGTRFDGEYVASTNRVYFLGFRTVGDATDGSVWYFDVATKSYADTGIDMPVPVSNYGIAALRDAAGLGLYIFGGRDANMQIVTTVQVYHPATNTAAVINNDPWPGTTPSGCVSLPAMGVATLSNKAIVMGGASFLVNGCVDDNSRQTWSYDPMGTPGSRWSRGPNLNLARGYITPAVLGNTVYAIGGDTNQAGMLFATATVESWTPPANSWNDAGVADLPQACDESQAFGLTAPRPTIILAGCGQWPNAVPATFAYDRGANTWSLAGQLNDNRRNQAGALITLGTKQVLYVVGGYGEDSQFIDPIVSSEISRLGGASPATASVGEHRSASSSASTT